ncbi:POC1 centriolar protein A [Ceratobasidium sp. 428]|nr:POC1 centriolar protein A [Ceratobasidium sp. 428]
MTTRRVLNTTGDAARKLLRLVEASTDVVPPIKHVASSALGIADGVKDFRTDEKEWKVFGEYVEDATASVVVSLSQVNLSHEDARSKLEKLNATLEDIKREIESEQTSSKMKRVGRFLENPEKIVDMRQRIESDIGLFQLSATITNLIDVGKIFDMVVASGSNLSSIAQATSAIAIETQSISRKTLQLGLNAAIDKLLRAPGASWDPDQACMENTRVQLVRRIHAWINSPAKSGGAEIMLLTAVAGAGKTTVAHTIARECHRNGQLGSSFFFDCEISGRNSPAALFATVAADLSRLDPRIAEHISGAIEEDNSLPTAPVSRQFEELMLKPCKQYPTKRPIVLVVDALDEAWDTRGREDKAMNSLLKILRDRISELPDTLRILLTSRMRPELNSLLRREHVTEEEINISSKSNMDDMTVYIPSKIRELAENRDLGSDWPSEEKRERFTTKAGGLFLWVAIVCEYLSNCDDPDLELDDLVSTANSPNSSAEDQMSELYTRILESFNWNDARFTASYRRVMGAALATRIPLTLTALEELYQERPLASDFTLERLSPLLTGVRGASRGTEAIRVLHQSLRDFLVAGGTGSSGSTKFTIVEKDHSQRLASLCLELLDRDLSSTTPGTGYLTIGEDDTPGIPIQVGDSIPEALQYACQYWQSHIQDVEIPSEIMPSLKKFMEQKLVLWMELAAVCGRYYGLGEAEKWRQRVEKSDKNDIKLALQCNEEYASASHSISCHFSYEGRREEALVATQDSEATYRRLTTGQPVVFTPYLARSLVSLSHRLYDLGHHKEALSAIVEGVDLSRQLAAERPDVFIPELVKSLNHLSNCLSNMGRREEALSAIEEAVYIRRKLAAERPIVLALNIAPSLGTLSNCLDELGRLEEALTAMEETVHVYRQLATDQPALFAPELAGSLSNLSNRLSRMGRREEALSAIVEAVQVYRQLAAERPAMFTPKVAGSLNNLSNCLSGMARLENALSAIEEAVQLYRQLATERPTVFTSDLAMSLSNLSNHLSDMGRREDALLVIEEAVHLCRQLVAEQPTAFTPDLAMSLNNFSNCLARMGRHEDALLAIEEALHIRRRLAAEQPDAFTPNLARCLGNFSLHLSHTGRLEDALSAIEEAIQLYRQLAADRPAAFTPDLAASLNNLSNHLADMGRHEEALSAIEETVHIRRQLAAVQPAAFTPVLAESLNNLSSSLCSLGRLEDALSAAEEAAQMYRRLAMDQPAAFTPGLACSLETLSNRLSNMGRREEALEAIQEAVLLRRELSADCVLIPDSLRRSLWQLSTLLIHMGRREEALSVDFEAAGWLMAYRPPKQLEPVADCQTNP